MPLSYDGSEKGSVFVVQRRRSRHRRPPPRVCCCPYRRTPVLEALEGMAVVQVALALAATAAGRARCPLALVALVALALAEPSTHYGPWPGRRSARSPPPRDQRGREQSPRRGRGGPGRWPVSQQARMPQAGLNKLAWPAWPAWPPPAPRPCPRPSRVRTAARYTGTPTDSNLGRRLTGSFSSTTSRGAADGAGRCDGCGEPLPLMRSIRDCSELPRPTSALPAGR